MGSKSLMIKAQRQQLRHMFYLRGLFGSGRNFYFVLALLSVIFILVTCNQCPVNGVQNQLFEKKIKSSISFSSDTVEFSLSDGFLTPPPVEIRPPLLDWGHRSNFNPSVAYLTVKNMDVDIILSVYDLHSTSSQFYPCNFFSQILLAPGEFASICFIFLPTSPGLSSAQLILQTSVGGFLIQARGFAIELPYLMKTLGCLDTSSSGRWRKNLSLFKSFHEALYVEVISSVEDLSEYNIMLSVEDWLVFDIGQPQIALRLHENWVANPRETGAIPELDFSSEFEGKIIADFWVELHANHVALYMESLVPCNTSDSIVYFIFVRNDASYLLRVIKVSQVGKSIETFQMIKSDEGLNIIFPDSMKCKILKLINDIKTSQMKIPFIDVIKVWTRMKKSMVVLLFLAFLLCFLFFFLLCHVAAFPSQDFESGGSFVISSHIHLGWKKLRFLGSTQLNNSDQETTTKNGLLSPSLVENNVDMQDKLESQNLRVRVGKGRRRRKKKGNEKILYQFEASSNHSSNSTPTSPLSPHQKSPLSKSIPKRDHKSDQCSSKVNLLDNEVHLSTTQEKPSLTCHAPVLASTSTISPHTRAPGTKIEKIKKASGVEEKMGFDEQKYVTYDIWGDHLFGLPLAFYQSKNEVSSGKPLLSVFQNNDSDSFFVRGPQTLFEKPWATSTCCC